MRDEKSLKGGPKLRIEVLLRSIEAMRTLQSGVPDNLRGCWSRLYPYASRAKYQSASRIKFRAMTRTIGGREPRGSHLGNAWGYSYLPGGVEP